MKRKIGLLISVLLLSAIMVGCASSAPKEYIEYIVPGEYLVTNVSDTYRLIKAAPVLAINREGLTDQLKAEQHKIRDTMIGVIRTKTEEQMRSAGIMDELRVEIKQALVDQLGMDYLVAVYFSDFVLQ